MTKVKGLKRPQLPPWTLTVPVISTGHLPKSVYDALEAAIASHAQPGAVYPEGMWLWVVPLEEGPPVEGGYAPALVALFRWALARGVEYVRLDADGAEVDGLEVFEW